MNTRLNIILSFWTSLYLRGYFYSVIETLLKIVSWLLLIDFDVFVIIVVSIPWQTIYSFFPFIYRCIIQWWSLSSNGNRSSPTVRKKGQQIYQNSVIFPFIEANEGYFGGDYGRFDPWSPWPPCPHHHDTTCHSGWVAACAVVSRSALTHICYTVVVSLVILTSFAMIYSKSWSDRFLQSRLPRGKKLYY